MKKKDIRVAIITVSDRCSEGIAEDKSGPILRSLFEEKDYFVSSYLLLPDDEEAIKRELLKLCKEKMDLIITTGGTGFAKRDVTVEATLAVSDKLAPGISEAIRSKSLVMHPNAMLSRAVSVIHGSTLIINFPGSPSACTDAFNVIEGVLVHAIGLLRGEKMDK